MKISNCCSAPVYEDTDICMECKEHCAVIEENDYQNQGPFAAMNKDVGEFNNKVDDLISNLKKK